MKPLNLVLIFLFTLVLSSCSNSLTQTIPQTVSPSPVAANTTTVVTPTSTDDQLMQDLSTDPDFKIDSTLDNLNSELK